MPTYDPATALIVVDLQNDFADPAGSLPVCRRGGDHPGGQRAVRRAARWRRVRRRHPGLASGVDAALRQGRRDLAGPLRRRHLGRGAPPGARCRRRARGSARAPTARTATPASRCATRSGARATRPSSRRSCASGASSGSSSAASRPTTASRRPRSTRSASASRPTLLGEAVAAVDLEPGDGERALDEMAEAGVAAGDRACAQAGRRARPTEDARRRRRPPRR